MKSTNLILGAVLLIVAAGLAYIALTHRPTDGVVDAIKRFNDGALKPTVYYSLLVAAILLALAGAWQIVTGLKRAE
jgi:hypothetical protein